MAVGVEQRGVHGFKDRDNKHVNADRQHNKPRRLWLHSNSLLVRVALHNKAFRLDVPDTPGRNPTLQQRLTLSIHTDEKHLIHRFQQGDTEAFNPLVVKYQHRIYSLIYRQVHNRETVGSSPHPDTLTSLTLPLLPSTASLLSSYRLLFRISNAAEAFS